MSNAFGDIAFTSAVKAAQQRDGSRAAYARNYERGAEAVNHQLGPDEEDFIAAQRSFTMATVIETGWPYVQHRGGPRGFLKVLDASTLAFADFAGNRQMVTVGNVAGNDRVALILIDYANRRRLKILGRLRIRELADGERHEGPWLPPGYPARPQRVFTIKVEAFDWNCPQHIPELLDAEEVKATITALEAQVAELERRLSDVMLRSPSPPATPVAP